MKTEDYDLLIRAGRIVCPKTALDGPGAVAVRGDCIAAVGADVAGTAKREFDLPDAVLLPGLIDLHAHPAKSDSVFGVDPDQHILARGTTTVLSQGDAGADHCEAFVRQTIQAAKTRVRLAINLSSVGESTPEGCFEQIENVDVSACLKAIGRFSEHIWGLAVNVSHLACGATDPHEVLSRGLQVAEETGLPLLYGLRRPADWPFEDQLALLRPGDVVTYCFRCEPHGIVANGRVHPAVRSARQRGILFDIGHGKGSFDFPVAEAAIRDGFPPDTISTDLQKRHLSDEPVHDLPRTMSKLLAVGMAEQDVFAAATAKPADVLRLSDEIGSLHEGRCADLTLLHWRDDGEPLVDVNENQRPGGFWEAVMTVRGGSIVYMSPEIGAPR